MNSKNSKTCEPHKLLLNLADKSCILRCTIHGKKSYIKK